MLYNKIVLTLAALLLLAVFSELRSQSLSLPADSVIHVWPTDASRQLSSTFAETRSAHLHAGIDIRTWGREGYRVFATRDGIIHRISMSPFGYGNAIYMKHEDDSYSVYAHLNRFEPGLQAFADSIRLTDYRADLDLILHDRSIRFQQGDIIGYTGSTGVGPPHLHFELRDANFNPFNPLLTNIGVQDNIPPVFRQLAVEYLEPNTLKPTGFDIFDATLRGRNYSFGEIVVDGPVGLSLNVHDRANNTPNIYAVYALMVTHKADTLYHEEKEYFSFPKAGQMFLDRSYPILAQTRRGFQRLYVVEGNELPFYRIKKNRGIIHFEDGKYPLEITASDIYGNRSTAFVTLHVKGNRRPVSEITYVPTYPEIPKGESSKPLVFLSDISIHSSGPQINPSEQSSLSYQRIKHLFPFISGQSVRKKISPNTTSLLSTPDRNIWVQFPHHAVYDTMDIKLTTTVSDGDIFFRFEPDRLPLRAPITFNFILPDHLIGNSQLGLFSVDTFRNRQVYLDSNNSGRVIRATMNEISTLVLKEDSAGPWVGRARIDRNNAGKHIIIVPVRDEITGIDYRRSTITVNDRRGIVEYDPEKNFLIYYHPEFRPSQSNRVVINVFDGVGNQSSLEVTLTY
jgi:murein DD-endopeptidase MepM/ murein hydrolase activator NlpD